MGKSSLGSPAATGINPADEVYDFVQGFQPDVIVGHPSCLTRFKCDEVSGTDVDGSNKKWGHLMDGHRYMFFSRNLKWIWTLPIYCDVIFLFFLIKSMMIFTIARCFCRSFTIMLSLSQHAEALCH